MANKKLKTKEGFTIIEVVLVLAIAGLIFLMVFVALPALQRSQRDTQRRDAMAELNNAVVQYQTNNNTNLPGKGSYKPNSDGTFGDSSECTKNTACRFIRDYLNTADIGDADAATNTFEDPNKEFYSLVITDNLKTTKGVVDYKTLDGSRGKLEGDGENGITITGEGAFNDYIMYLIPGAKCDGEYAKTAEKRHFAILYRLEGAGVACVNS